MNAYEQGVDLINDQTKRLVSLGIWINLLPVCEPVLPWFVTLYLSALSTQVVHALYFMHLLGL